MMELSARRASRAVRARAGQLRLGVVACGVVSWMGVAQAHAPSSDLLNLDFQQLTEVLVSEASGFEQSPEDAPVTVTVITRENIRDFGWLTLSEALAGVVGLFPRNDRNYDYLGIPVAGDYNSRFLLLIDGVRVTDGIYKQALTGHTAIIGMESIDRIEYIAGAGSALHGGNAYYGTINVITSSGADGGFAGVQVGSLGVARGYGSSHVHWGDSLLSVSGSRFKRRGDNVYYPEYDTPDQNNGVATDLDGETDDNLLIKWSLGKTRVLFAYSDRERAVSTASYEQTFNDPRSSTRDNSVLLSLGHDWQLRASTQLSVDASVNRYRYVGRYVYGPDDADLSEDRSRAQSLRLTGRLRHAVSDSLQLLAGVDLNRDTELVQQNLTPALGEFYLNRDDQRDNVGVYVAGEWEANARFTTHLGLRVDEDSISGSQFSPRLGVTTRWSETFTMKLVTAQAFRPPNAYELYYAVPGEGGALANPTLEPERIRSTELSLDYRPAGRWQFRGHGFYAELRDVLLQVPVPPDGELVFINGPTVHVTGLLADATASLNAGIRLRAGISWMSYHLHDEVISNPETELSSVTLNMTVPLLQHRLIAGVEARYLADVEGRQGTADAFGLLNLNLRAPNLPFGLEASLRISNVLDTDYAYIGGPEHLQTTLPQDDRTLLFGLRKDW